MLNKFDSLLEVMSFYCKIEEPERKTLLASIFADGNRGKFFNDAFRCNNLDYDFPKLLAECDDLYGLSLFAQYILDDSRIGAFFEQPLLADTYCDIFFLLAPNHREKVAAYLLNNDSIKFASLLGSVEDVAFFLFNVYALVLDLPDYRAKFERCISQSFDVIKVRIHGIYSACIWMGGLPAFEKKLEKIKSHHANSSLGGEAIDQARATSIIWAAQIAQFILAQPDDFFMEGLLLKESYLRGWVACPTQSFYIDDMLNGWGQYFSGEAMLEKIKLRWLSAIRKVPWIKERLPGLDFALLESELMCARNILSHLTEEAQADEVVGLPVLATSVVAQNTEALLYRFSLWQQERRGGVTAVKVLLTK